MSDRRQQSSEPFSKAGIAGDIQHAVHGPTEATEEWNTSYVGGIVLVKLLSRIGVEIEGTPWRRRKLLNPVRLVNLKNCSVNDWIESRQVSTRLHRNIPVSEVRKPVSSFGLATAPRLAALLVLVLWQATMSLSVYRTRTFGSINEQPLNKV